MLIEIPRKLETKETVSLLPGHYKFGSTFYKVAETACLMVTLPSMFSEGDIRILTPEKHNIIIANILDAETVNKEDFDSALCEVHNRQAAIQLQQLLKTA